MQDMLHGAVVHTWCYANEDRGPNSWFEQSSACPDTAVQLEDGSAEVFGAELLKGDRVNVRGQKLAVRVRLCT